MSFVLKLGTICIGVSWVSHRYRLYYNNNYNYYNNNNYYYYDNHHHAKCNAPVEPDTPSAHRALFAHTPTESGHISLSTAQRWCQPQTSARPQTNPSSSVGVFVVALVALVLVLVLYVEAIVRSLERGGTCAAAEKDCHGGERLTIRGRGRRQLHQAADDVYWRWRGNVNHYTNNK